jgi:hypothetical protein
MTVSRIAPSGRTSARLKARGRAARWATCYHYVTLTKILQFTASKRDRELSSLFGCAMQKAATLACASSSEFITRRRWDTLPIPACR